VRGALRFMAAPHALVGGFEGGWFLWETLGGVERETTPPTPPPGWGFVATREAAEAYRPVPFASQRRLIGLCGWLVYLVSAGGDKDDTRHGRLALSMGRTARRSKSWRPGLAPVVEKEAPGINLVQADPTRLSTFVHDKTVELVRGGVWLSTAAEALGIPVRTMFEWYAAGGGESSTLARTEPYVSFRRDVDASMALAEKTVLHRLLANNDWRAQAWWLEHGPPRKRWQENAMTPTQEAAVALLDALRARALAPQASLPPISQESLAPSVVSYIDDPFGEKEPPRPHKKKLDPDKEHPNPFM